MGGKQTPANLDYFPPFSTTTMMLHLKPLEHQYHLQSPIWQGQQVDYSATPVISEYSCLVPCPTQESIINKFLR